MNINKEKIHIFSCIDNNYAQHLAVLLRSIFHTNPYNEIVFYVIYNKLDNKNIQRLENVAKKSNIKILFLYIEESILDNITLHYHYEKTIFYKFICHAKLVKYTDRIIYIDSDCLVLGSLSDLWKIDLEKSYFAATPDHLNFKHDRHTELGFANSKSYFNVGVLLIDIKKWVESDNTKKIIEFAEKNSKKLIYAEQDAANYVLRGNYKRLGHIYNYSTIHAPNFMTTKKIEKLENIVIYHFAGVSKPWNFDSTNSMKSKYWKYLKETPWKFSLYRDISKITPKIFIKHYLVNPKIFVVQIIRDIDRIIGLVGIRVRKIIKIKK